MRAMVLTAPGTPLQFQQRDDPVPAPGAVRVKISACGVCRTDLHVVDGELPDISYPVIPGHEVVGRVEALGQGVTTLEIGERVGIPWLGYTCGECPYCRRGQENLCDRPLFTGYTRDGGFATHLVADARFAFARRGRRRRRHRTLAVCRPDRLALAGDGGRRKASRHLWFRRRRTYHRAGGPLAGTFRLRVHARWRYRGATPGKILGVVWAGDSEQPPPVPLDAAIIYAPVGGWSRWRCGRYARVAVWSAPAFTCRIFLPFLTRMLWEERQLLSVANLTRNDGIEFFKVAAQAGIKTHTTAFPLREANEVLSKLRSGQITGAAVLQP